MATNICTTGSTQHCQLVKAHTRMKRYMKVKHTPACHVILECGMVTMPLRQVAYHT